MTGAPGKILAIAAGACLFSVCALAGGAPAFVTDNSASPASTIPVVLVPVFEAAATASLCAVPWTLLAAVAATESAFDPTAVSGAGAQGLFQFEPATFAEYATPVPADGAHPASPFDPVDAAYAAGRYLCSLGVVENPFLALVAYNCGNAGPACQAASASYAEKVLLTAAGYAAADTGSAPTTDPGAP
jgi:soluble lytic murein transglycosylase-like protein